MKENIILHNYRVDCNDRRKSNKHNSFLIWVTGLSGSGKSTISNELEYTLHQKGIKTYVLDGDNIRNGINQNLTFSPEDRSENIRRIAEISKLFIDAGIVVIGAFISPYHKDRQEIKKIVGASNFVEVYVNTSVEECERRDVKGLYKKARNGEIKNFTGISAPYEAPQNPDIEIKTENETVEGAMVKIVNHIKEKLTYNG
ncbi:adenylyl-sulfate kinase [Lutibacter sp. HS1-25]|uniref:adenylyl-sulfate kinase n=1 Tax=Lutibacter sp. HS1-25 TaxID=2485000 RepID=UPI001012C4DB|nr:adenylyl-sulfate kinase [Lutibacter sp. HS1-25]RXP45420.1 adenylyl-sulfate kinase [Lutibacter sp. HS1-25]